MVLSKMNVPDAAVYAALPMIGGFAVWVAGRFVKQVAGPQGERGERGEAGRVSPELTVRDFQLIADELDKRLNVKYMLADEARGRFMSLEAKIERHAEEMRRSFARCEFANAHNQDRP
jgi:hypothetical protein